MSTDWLPTLLQNSDSAFPTGAYAHSHGLEEMARLGVVCDEESLARFLDEEIIPALQHQELPYVRFAYEAGDAGNLTALAGLSEEINAWKLSAESRKASLQVGAGRLETARRITPHPQLEMLAASSFAKHLIVVYGWQMAHAGVPLEAALTGYFYQAVAGYGSASLKLMRIGQQGAQRVLARALEVCGAVVSASRQVARSQAGWFSPRLDIATMRHAEAFERLFIS